MIARRQMIATTFVVTIIAMTASDSIATAGRIVPGARAIAVVDDDPSSARVRFSDATLNNRGEVAFQAFELARHGGGGGFFRAGSIDASGAASSTTAVEYVADAHSIGVNELGIYSEAGGNGLTRIAHVGGYAPGINAEAVFSSVGLNDESTLDSSFDNVRITDSGHTVFRGAVRYATGESAEEVDAVAIYRHEADDLQLVAREWEQVPGFADGIVFSDLRSTIELSLPEGDSISVNDSGEIAFGARFLNVAENRQGNGVFAARRNRDLEAVSVTGDPVTYFSDIERVVEIHYPTSGISAEGKVTFVAYASNDDPSNLTAVLREGDDGIESVGPLDPTFTTASGDVELSFLFSHPVYNDRGQISALGQTDVGPVIFSNGRGESLELLAKVGDSVSGSDDVIAWIDYGSVLAIDNYGRTAFYAVMGTGNYQTDVGVLMLASDEGLFPIATSDDVVPGLQDEIRLGFFDLSATFNNQGRLAFDATLSDGSRAILAQDIAGQVQLVVRAGDRLDVNNDPTSQDLRTISHLQFGSSAPSHPDYAFNDRGEVAFVAHFTDGTSGVFVVNVNAVPEPSSCLLILSATVLALSRRCRDRFGDACITPFLK